MYEIAVSERVMDFTGQISLVGGCAVAGGGYSDVWRAILNSRKDGHGQELKVRVVGFELHPCSKIVAGCSEGYTTELW